MGFSGSPNPVSDFPRTLPPTRAPDLVEVPLRGDEGRRLGLSCKHGVRRAEVGGRDGAELLMHDDGAKRRDRGGVRGGLWCGLFRDAGPLAGRDDLRGAVQCRDGRVERQRDYQETC